MNHNQLGNTGVLVSEICLGTMTVADEQLTKLDEVSATPKPYPQWMIER